MAAAARVRAACLVLLVLSSAALVVAQEGGDTAKPEQQQRKQKEKKATTAPPATKKGKDKGSSSSSSSSDGEARTSNIIPSAGSAKLTNGIGDVLADGPCKADAKAFCKDIRAGDGRLAACLSARLAAEKKGNVAGRAVSDGCRDDLTEFKIDRNENINKDPALANACKDDVKQYCPKESDADTPGSVAACLRNWGMRLSSLCKRELIRTMLEVAEDWRLDPTLHSACSAAVDDLCDGVEPGEGREIECLAEKSKQLSWDCLHQVLMFQRSASEDIRLNVRLFRACVNDQRRYCADVEPGHWRVQECLEDHLDDDGFSPVCRQQLDDAMVARVANFSLDPALAEACKDDLKAACSTSPEEVEDDEDKRRAAVNCLQTFKDELKSDACRDKVHRQMARAARDIRFDDALARACRDDRQRFCAAVQPGSARVIRCLQDARGALSAPCTAALFDHEVKMAEDIDFKYPMRRACAWEVAALCGGKGHGHARVIGCLQQNLQHEDMSQECRAEVTRDANRAATDYRLNWRLKRACEADIGRLCAGLCPAGGSAPCGGLVLQCLTERADNVTSPECQEEVFYYRLMEVSDFRNDVILAEACRADVDKYCKDVEPGGGRVHACLRHQTAFLSDACRAEEGKLAAAEHRDIRLKPKLARACSQERAAFCRDTKPGRARVVRCLIDHMSAPTFGAECREQLHARAQQVLAGASGAGVDGGVADACGEEIESQCADAKTKLRANAEVLKCLINGFEGAGEACQNELSRAARYALWDYSSGSPLTAACDGDVESFCPKHTAHRPGGVFTIGVAGRCLSKALVEGGALAPGCRALVLAAAPRDARAYLSLPGSTSALVRGVSAAQRAAGLEGVLVDAYRRDGGVVTVTGWAALACVASICVVTVVSVGVVLRRAYGLDRPHAQYIKSGDA